jgi:hypothetical protein
MTEETTQVDPNPEVTITLRVNEVNIILAGLQELPFKVAEPLIKSIIAQAQNNLAQEAVAEAATEA